jgi:hypothetical protein
MSVHAAVEQIVLTLWKLKIINDERSNAVVEVRKVEEDLGSFIRLGALREGADMRIELIVFTA